LLILNKFKKNQILTAAAAPSVLTFARVCAADISLPVRAESPLTKVADTRQPVRIAHPTNFLLPSSFFLLPSSFFLLYPGV
jgi:hypothetical protein